MLAIRAGQLIDGNGGLPLHDAIVLVEGERIVQVGRAAEVSVPPEAEVIDAGAQSVIPGLIDCHVHIHAPGGDSSGGGWELEQIASTQGLFALRAYRNARQALAMGYTTLRSVHSPAYVDVALRDAINQGIVEGPRLKVAGQGLTISGGHMDDIWAPEVTIAGRTGVADGPWGLRRAARIQIKNGVDLIKINAAVSLHSLDYSHKLPYHQELTYEEMAAVCEEAHWAGKRVAAHAYGGQGLTDALHAGLDSVEHGPWLSDEDIEWMVSHGVFYVPTLSVYACGLALGAKGSGTSPAGQNWLKQANEAKWHALERAKKAGVKIATGTDAGFWVKHGENAHELEEMVQGGLAPMEAIVAATHTGAACLDMAREVGTIESGKYADLVVVDGDPLADIKVLQDRRCIARVIKGGRQVRSAGDGR